MNKKFYQVLLAIVIPCIPFAFAHAQDNVTKRTLTLDECISIGLEKNLEINWSKFNINRSKTGKLEALGQFVPTLGASASWTRNDRDQNYFVNDMVVTSRDNYNISASSQLTLFDGMANFNTVDKSLIESKSAELGYSRQKETFTYSVYDAYYTTLRYEQLVKVNEANLERAQKQLDRIREQVSVGSSAKADAYRQEVEVGRYELLYHQSKNDFENAKADLLSLIGETPNQSIALDESSLPLDVKVQEAEQYIASLGTFGQLYQRALDSRKDYKSSELSIESAEKSVNIAWSGHIPSLTASARYNWNNFEFKDVLNDGSFSYGVTLSVPILSNFRTASAIQYAEINEMETNEIHTQLERTIALNIRKALNALEYAVNNVRIAQQTLRSAQEDQRIASEKYNIGSGILLDLITANANLISAESDVVNSRFNYVRARTLLEYHLGISL